MAIIKTILSPEVVKAVDSIQQSRCEQREQQKEARPENDGLLKPDGDVDVTNREAQRGRRILRGEFIRRLQKLNPNLKYEQSKNYPSLGGIYFVGYRKDTLVGTEEYGKWFVCGIPHEAINEFSIPLTVPDIVPSTMDPIWDSINKVDGLERGWRSVLLTLMQMEMLTPTQIDNEFKIREGRSSQKWQEALN